LTDPDPTHDPMHDPMHTPASTANADPGPEAKSATWQRGLAVRKHVLGDAYVDRAFEQADAFSRDWQDFVTEHAWGAAWARPGLALKTRSMLNVAMLVALNRPHELEIHLRGALRNGVTDAELREILIQCAVYCGAPAAMDGFRVARKVLAERDAGG